MGQADGRTLLAGDRAGFALLAVFLGCAGAFSLAFGLAEGIDSTAGRTGFVAFVGALALAGLTWLVAPRFGARGLDVCLVGTGFVIAASAAQASDAHGQLSAALVLLMLGVITAFFVPSPRMWVLIAIQMAGYAVAVAWDEHAITPWAYLVLGAANLVLATTVAWIGRSMRDEAEHDPLTDVLNRHGFEEQAGVLTSVARRAGLGVFVAYVDLDGFKRYNDVHGHAAGDQLLADVAHAWSRVLRGGDLLVRWGGDEFLVVMAAPAASAAEVVLGRMRAAHDAAWTFGLAEWIEGDDLDTVVERADGALLDAKAQRVPGVVGHSDRGPWPDHWSEPRRTRAALASQLDPQILIEPVRLDDGEIVDFRLVDANAAACAFLQLPIKDAVGTRIRDQVPGEPREWLFDRMIVSHRTGEPVVIDGYEHVDANGRPRRFDFRIGRYDDALSITWREVTRRFADGDSRADASAD